MRIFTPLLLMALLAVNSLFAEGTRELAPNASIDVNGNNTTDIAALHINNPSYNNFAAFDNPDPQSRLYIHIKDPNTECIYLGFNWAHNNLTSPNPPRVDFSYQIKDPNGNIVFGPVSVTPATANIQSWSEAFNGPMQLYGPAGYNATQVTSAILASQGWTGKGDYYIEFRDEENNDLLIDFWDISVTNCNSPNPTEIKGRVWSYNWSIFAINDFGFPNRPFNGAFYVCAPDPDDDNASFVTKINFNGSGFRPAAFNVAFNSFGSMNSGDVNEDRKSVMNVNATQAEYSIFLNDPVDICSTATVGQIELIGIGRCSGNDYCIKFTTTKAGQIDLLLDFDGQDNMYTPGTADRVISKTVSVDEVGIPTCIQWDGLDGLGNPMPEFISTQIPITIAYAQGIYHFPIYDAELMTNGFMISSIRPAAPVSLLFYDDSNISVPSGSGEPATQLSGCMPPCHRWTNYTQPNTPGFGNLHTINSWWFSQLVIRQDLFNLPAFLACNIQGPTTFCAGGTSQLSVNTVISPAFSDAPEVVATIWDGPGIVGANDVSNITIDEGGEYFCKILWVNNLGDTCESVCEYVVFVNPPLEDEIDTLILQGETIVINGESYNAGGTYIQELTTSEGCDSILTINIIVLNTVVYYDLNDCESFMADGSHMDYSEFVPSYPQPLPCATIVADTLHRENPQVNKHSCTPGVNNSKGMCVGTLAGCDYIAGHEASVVIEINITPDPDTAVYLTGFSFYEKAPLNFDWIFGESGPNNYPTLFRLRVLKNGTEIFLTPATTTAQDWTQRVYDFLGNDDFLVKDPTTFRFELLSYCPIGNGATESVWDLDEIEIVASCASITGFNEDIAGNIKTPTGLAVPNVTVSLFEDVQFINPQITTSDAKGAYVFESQLPETDYYVRGLKNDDPKNGVSTIDLIHIQKHLLGIRLFQSPYQYIAADANNSKTVTAIDLIELRKLLLGIYDELPRNTSWRFGDAKQVLDISQPWLFDETIDIEYLTDNILDADFVGVKIGDVNHDVLPAFTGGGIKNRTSSVLQLGYNDVALTSGVPVHVPITSSQMASLSGMQISLAIKDGSIRDVLPGALNIEESNFFITNDGVLRLSWNAAQALPVGSNETLFTIVVVGDKAGTLSDMMSVNEGPLAPEVYLGDDLELYNIELSSEHNQNQVSETVLSGCVPNPFTDEAEIRFTLAKNAEVTFSFYNLSGQQLLVSNGTYSEGRHRFTIRKQDLQTENGIVICRMQAGDYVGTQKLILLQ
jgi:hypothetical protein